MQTANKKSLSQNHYLRWITESKAEMTEEDKKNCEFGHSLHKKAHLLYPNSIEPCDNRSFDSRLEQSEALLKARLPLLEPLFLFDNLSVQVDILNPLSDGTWELIEVKGKKDLLDEWIKYTAFQYYVCINAGVKVSKVSILHLQRYVTENTPLEKIFDKTDITDKVMELQEEIKSEVNRMREDAINNGV